MPIRPRSVAGWVRRQLATEPPRSKSLIMTIFGDSIAPFLPGIWLGELVRLLEPFGVNERLVRTSGFRLAEEGWLRPERNARRSRYMLTQAGQVRVAHASRRIYHPPPETWDRRWTVLMLRRSENLAADRMQLRQELEWEGFGTLAPGIFVHPGADRESLREILERLGLRQNVVLLQGAEVSSVTRSSTPLLVADCWRLELVSARYEAFVANFRPVLDLVQRGVDAQEAFVLQTLLIHSFRRVVLHDPRLPRPLLPQDWPGLEAYALCKAMYLQTHMGVGEFLAEHVEGFHEICASAEFMERFGGLNGEKPAELTSAAPRGG